MPLTTVHKLTMRAALLVGFGLIVGVWLLVGVQVTRQIASAQADTAAANDRYVQAQDLLTSVRSQVLVASVIVRDALLDPGPRPSGAVERLATAYEGMDAMLRTYVPVVDASNEQARVGRLRQELEALRAESMAVLTATDSSRWPLEAGALLHRLTPRRESVISISEGVQAFNRSNYVTQQAATAAMYRAAQQQIWTRLGIALGFSIAIGVMASTYAGRLERRLRQQRAVEQRNASELHRLSARLVRAREEEQRRISRELHDEIGQALTAVKMELISAQKRIRLGTADVECLDPAQAITDTALQSVRDLSRLLHPAALDDLGLVVALDAYVAEFATRHGIRAEFVDEGMDERLDHDVEANLYRIVQEALTNVARHSGATFTEVRLRRDHGGATLTVRDDGRGFSPEEVAQAGGRRGLGLVGVRERVSSLRGTLRIDSGPDIGTTLRVSLPLGSSLPPSGAVAQAHPLQEDVGAVNG